MCLQCQSLIKAIDAYIKKADDDLADALKDEGYVEPEKTVEHADDIEQALEDAFIAENAYIIEQAEKAIDLETFASDIWPGVKLTKKLKLQLIDIFKDQLTEFMPQYVEYYIQQTDKELVLSAMSKRTTSWISTWSNDLADLMQLSSEREIESILSKGLKNGDGVADFARAIQDSGLRDPYWKARRASITEVLRAHSVAQQEAFMQSPAVESKQWRHTGSYRNDPRKNHENMNGQVVKKADPYTLFGADGATYFPMYPRDTNLPASESVNCHCISQPVVNQDILGFTLEERKAMQQEAIDEMDAEWEEELDAQNRAKAGVE